MASRRRRKEVDEEKEVSPVKAIQTMSTPPRLKNLPGNTSAINSVLQVLLNNPKIVEMINGDVEGVEKMLFDLYTSPESGMKVFIKKFCRNEGIYNGKKGKSLSPLEFLKKLLERLSFDLSIFEWDVRDHYRCYTCQEENECDDGSQTNVLATHINDSRIKHMSEALSRMYEEEMNTECSHCKNSCGYIFSRYKKVPLCPILHPTFPKKCQKKYDLLTSEETPLRIYHHNKRRGYKYELVGAVLQNYAGGYYALLKKYNEGWREKKAFESGSRKKRPKTRKTWWYCANHEIEKRKERQISRRLQKHRIHLLFYERLPLKIEVKYQTRKKDKRKHRKKKKGSDSSSASASDESSSEEEEGEGESLLKFYSSDELEKEDDLLTDEDRSSTEESEDDPDKRVEDGSDSSDDERRRRRRRKKKKKGKRSRYELRRDEFKFVS